MKAAGERLAKCTVQRVQRRRQEVRLLVRQNGVIRETPIAMDADRLKVGAEIDPAALAFRAVPASDIGVTRHPHTGLEVGHIATDRFDDADELMTGCDGRFGGKFSEKQMAVRPANAAGLDTNEKLVGFRNRLLDVAQCQFADILQKQRLHMMTSQSSLSRLGRFGHCWSSNQHFATARFRIVREAYMAWVELHAPKDGRLRNRRRGAAHRS